MKKINKIAMYLILLICLVCFAFAQQPTLLSLQGKLTNSSTGARIQSNDLRININDSSGVVFNQNYSNIVSNGIFDLVLGSTYQLNLSYNTEYNLTVYANNVTRIGGPFIFRGGQGQVGGGDIATTESFVFGNVSVTGNFSVGGNLSVDSGTLFVDSLGNRVGIGNTIPNVSLDVSLDVSGSANISGIFYAGSANITNTIEAAYFVGDGSLLSGIDTSFTNNTDINVTNFVANNTLFVNGSRVGIGTANPSQKLVVDGSINITQNLSISGETQGDHKNELVVESISSGQSAKGMVLLMHFNNDTAVGENHTSLAGNGTVVVYDYSDAANNGALWGNTSGVSWTYNPGGGKFNGAFNLEGDDDYINVSSGAGLNDMNETTISAWIYAKTWGEISNITNFTSTFNQSGTIVSKINKNSNGWSLLMQGQQDNLTTERLYFSQGFSTTDGLWVTENQSLTLDTWHHVAVVYNRSSSSKDPFIYIDGRNQSVEELITPSGSASPDTAQDLLMGIRNNAGKLDRGFNGTIDEIAIWNRSLSESEIIDIYRKGHDNVFVGDVLVTGDVRVDENIWVRGNLTFTSGADYAEMFESNKVLEQGDVVCLDEKKKISKCNDKSDPSVIGVVSTNPTIIGRNKFSHAYPVGLVGVVPTKVKGPVDIFSLLTTSSYSGYAEKATIEDFGAIIGKAMEECYADECLIDVVVGLK